MPTRFELYTPIHKGLRRSLALLSIKAGKLEYENQGAVRALVDEIQTQAALVTVHHTLEERFIHPLVNAKVPGGAEILEEEHRVVTHLLDNLTAYAAQMQRATERENRQEVGLECYLALNRFISFFWSHLDREEEQIQPTLWRFYRDDELAKPWNQLLAAQRPDEAQANLELILAASSVSDLVAEFQHVDVSALPKEQPDALALAEQILSAEEWGALKAKLGTP